MRVLRAALIYFAIVFGVGFVAGTIRTLAGRLESPLMLIAAFFVARFVTNRLRPATATELLGTGFLALGFLVLAEFALAVPVRFATRDPVSGTVYYFLLAVYAFMPLFVYRN